MHTILTPIIFEVKVTFTRNIFGRPKNQIMFLVCPCHCGGPFAYLIKHSTLLTQPQVWLLALEMMFGLIFDAIIRLFVTTL